MIRFADTTGADGESEGRRCGVVSGALGQGNVGDDSLLGALLRLHAHDYSSLLYLSHGLHPSVDCARLPFPRLAYGRRFWRGWWHRRGVLSRIRAWATGEIDYVWIGGLLGNPGHAQGRHSELLWAGQFCRRFVYYFGDAGEEVSASSHYADVVRLLDSDRNFISVRSEEAATVLRRAGMKCPIHVGCDPVLYSLCQSAALPIRRPTGRAPVIAIIPTAAKVAAEGDLYFAAAESAHRHGLGVQWTPFASEDEHYCGELAHRLGLAHPSCRQELVPTDQSVATVRRATVCLTGRYHGMIYSFAAGVPTIALTWNDKLARLSRLLGLEDWAVNMLDPATARDPLGRLAELVRRGVEGDYRPDYTALKSQLEAHRQVLGQFRQTLSRPGG
jgi:hypothetical protein